MQDLHGHTGPIREYQVAFSQILNTKHHILATQEHALKHSSSLWQALEGLFVRVAPENGADYPC